MKKIILLALAIACVVSAQTTINGVPVVTSGTALLGAANTFTTAQTIPTVIGGTAAGSALTLESTSGAGTTDAIIFKTGSQVEAMRILSNGFVGIGTNNPQQNLHISVPSGNAYIELSSGSANSYMGVLPGSTMTYFQSGNDFAIWANSTESQRWKTDGTTSLVGKYSTYNNIATVDNGVPSEVAHIDSTGLTAAVSSTALYTPAATGRFRISYYAKVTTAGTTSILGGTTGLVLTYTDGTDSVAQTAFTLPEDNQAGSALSVASGNTTNTTQAVVHGTGFIYAKTGVAINYAFGYSSTGTAMAYELHITVEAM